MFNSENGDSGWFWDTQVDTDTRTQPQFPWIPKPTNTSQMITDINNSYDYRINEARKAEQTDRNQAAVRAKEQMPYGVLGRISPDLSPEYANAVQNRQNMANSWNMDDTINAQKGDINRTDAEYRQMIANRDMENPAMIAAREKGAKELQRAQAGSLRSASEEAQAGGYTSGGKQASMAREANRDSTTARGNLERDLIIDNMKTQEALRSEAANKRAAGIGQLGSLQTQEAGVQDTYYKQSETLTGQAQDEVLRRQLLNLEALRQEKFGQLGIEELGVELGVTERGGTRQELVAEASQAESARHAQEMERINEIEANKETPAPSGGGSSIMCVVMWKLGLISDEVLKGDFEYCRQYIDDDTRRGYFFLTTPFARHCLKTGLDGWLIKILAPMTVAWANEMAHRYEPEKAKPHLLGKLMCMFGVPLCRIVGKIKKWCGYPRIGNNQSTVIFETVGALMPNLSTEYEKEADRMGER